MTTLTIRKIDDVLKSKLRMRAARHGVSMEEEVRQILQQNLNTPEPLRDAAEGEPDTQNCALDEFVGTWVDDPEFDDAIAVFEAVDEDLWK